MTNIEHDNTIGQIFIRFVKKIFDIFFFLIIYQQNVIIRKLASPIPKKYQNQTFAHLPFFLLLLLLRNNSVETKFLFTSWKLACIRNAYIHLKCFTFELHYVQSKNNKCKNEFAFFHIRNRSQKNGVNFPNNYLNPYTLWCWLCCLKQGKRQIETKWNRI